jgi:murein DD-endopeptidase MepM/ murein hydrolase activator NlpD
MVMRKKFTGGDQFQPKDGLIFYVHHMMMLNELKGGFGAYQISSALNAASGLSFGGIQRDISTNDKNNTAIFEAVLINAHTNNDKRIITDKEIELIQKNLYKPTKEFNSKDKQIYVQLKSKINQALSSENGQTMLNQDYQQQLLEKVQKVEKIIKNIDNFETKLFVEKSLAAQMMIVDTFNQFSPAVRIALVNLLNAQANAKISIPYSKPERFFTVPERVDIQTLIDFKLSLNYGQKHPQDTMRRINNIQHIVSKYADVTQIIPTINSVEPTIVQKNKDTNTIIDINQVSSALKLQEKSNRIYNRYTQKFETVSNNYVFSEKVQNVLIKQKQQQQSLQFNDILKIMLPDIENNKVHITSKFGPRAYLKSSPNHGGIDFNYEGGQKGINLNHPKVYTPISGEIIAPLNSSNPTNMLRIKDNNGFVHEFLHLDAHTVKIGDKVQMGQVIGYMGNKNVITHQHHVHYQIKDAITAKVIDPAKFWNQQILNKSQNENYNIINSSNANIWQLLPIDIDKKDLRYQAIHKALSNRLGGFSNLNIDNQDKIIRQYIQDKNKDYVQTIQENSAQNSINNTNDKPINYILPKKQYNEDEDINKQYTR